MNETERTQIGMDGRSAADPFSSKPSADPERFDALYYSMLRDHPFEDSYIGKENPYTGASIQSEEDYRTFLRESVYTELLSEKTRPEMPVRKTIKKKSEKDAQDPSAEELLAAMKAEVKRTEAERNYLERRKKYVHASYCLVLALMLLAALIVVPKLQRKSYLKGFDEGARGAVSTEAPSEEPPRQTAVRESSVESAVQTQPNSTEQEAAIYIGNKNSKKFHLPSCTGLPKERNQIFFESREEALEEGYVPCSICNP